MAGTKRKRQRTFGTVRKLPSGHWQARYTDPTTGDRVGAPTTFQAKGDANAWLALRESDIIRGTWRPDAPKVTARTTLRTFADSWLTDRDLAPRTRAEYRTLLDKLILPDLGDRNLAAIKPTDVRRWHADLDTRTGRTRRAHAYALLRSIMQGAVIADLIPANPCTIKGASHVKRAKHIRPATLTELATIVEAMPDRLRVMVMFASWCALRFGETAELRRRDVDVEQGVIRVRRGVTRVGGGRHVGPPKSTAGSRDVAIPPHLIPAVVAHLEAHVPDDPDALLFPATRGGHLATATLYRHFYAARHLAGRDDLRWHDLRHTGAVLAAATGATLAELMARLGHSTPAMAMRYQHAAAERDRDIAAALSRMVEANDKDDD